MRDSSVSKVHRCHINENGVAVLQYLEILELIVMNNANGILGNLDFRSVKEQSVSQIGRSGNWKNLIWRFLKCAEIGKRKESR